MIKIKPIITVRIKPSTIWAAKRIQKPPRGADKRSETEGAGISRVTGFAGGAAGRGGVIKDKDSVDGVDADAGGGVTRSRGGSVGREASPPGEPKSSVNPGASGVPAAGVGGAKISSIGLAGGAALASSRFIPGGIPKGVEGGGDGLKVGAGDGSKGVGEGEAGAMVAVTPLLAL